MSEQDWKTLVTATQRQNKYRTLGIGIGTIALAVLALVIFAPHIWLTPQAVEPEQVVERIPSAYDNVKVYGKAAIVYDLATGKVLYAKNAETQLPLASLTKLLSVYAASLTLETNAPVSISAHALAQEGDNGFSEGETFSFTELAKLALVASSNDAAEAIAETAGKVRAESRESLLASAASALGLSQTYAVNGTGLDENGSLSGGYGSAHDIAILAGEFLKRIPEIAHATLAPTVTAASRKGQSYTLKNTNPDVQQFTGLMLSKTGYTDLAGGNLAIVYDAGIGHPIAVVVLGSTRDERFLDVERLVKATGQYFSSLSLTL